MHILLTNDDGISAQGINSLYKVLSKNHKIFMIAPIDEKSGCSSAITMKNSLKIETHAENKFAVHGYTADCVNIGLKGEIIPNVDLVLSGINHGPNCGDDIYFSGTVAGARVGYIYGISSIAVSIDSFNKKTPYMDDFSEFIDDLISSLNIPGLEKPVFYNINYPDLPKNEIKGLKHTCLGKRHYQDSYKILHRDSNGFSLTFDGGITEHDKKDSDITEVKNGYISITPLTLDCTDYETLDRL